MCQLVIESYTDTNERRNYTGKVTFVGGFLFINPTIEAEKVGWYYFIASILSKYNSELTGKKVLLVTDHDLSKHDDINRQNVDIVPGRKIPNGFSLGYASSDRLDIPYNELVRYCDKVSSMFRNGTEVEINEFPVDYQKPLFCDYIVPLPYKRDGEENLPSMLYL